ncbi:hypothetical protein BDN72DRAFT_873007 [Pluteus cervinus]|uniref:Uncharacterized protein n=1 Tax=Pluteus cervinus TaxID=181527 RepID=A0ACD3A2Y9_9AGAR|nr:hypothetical protein BDN72DRAFT_873007 [Pluteus cervinus]
MPRGRKHTTDASRFRCLVCLRYNPDEYHNRSILLKSRSAHATTQCHKRAVERSKLAEVEGGRNTAWGNTHILGNSVEFAAPGNNCTSNRMSAAEEAMWMELDSGDTMFSAGCEPASEHERLREAFEQKIHEHAPWLHLSSEVAEGADVCEPLSMEESEDERVISDILESIDLDDAEDAESDSTSEVHDPHAESVWEPYPNKLACLLNIIDSLPRLRLSDSLLKVILWLLKKLGVKNVPSFDAFRKLQAKLQNKGVPTVAWKSGRGNHFSFNDVRTLIANDWANPLTCRHLRRYPVIPRGGVVSEVWHAEKWHKDLDRHLLSPMYDNGKHHYYIDEPAQLRDGTLTVLVRWLEDEEGNIWMDTWKITSRYYQAIIHDEQVVRMKAEALVDNMLDLVDKNMIPTWAPQTVAAGHPSRMPNPDRMLAQGDPLYVSFIDVFGDDVSGNRSKSWNKHWNIYITHRNLPRTLLYHQYHIHFVSTSPHASIPEQFEGIKTVIEATHREPVKVYHACEDRQIRFKIQCNCGPGDNPAQSEISGYVGGGGNYPCRKCDVGGTTVYKSSAEGFKKLFVPGNPRSCQEILQHVQSQVARSCFGVAQHVKDAQTKTGVKDGHAQFWIDQIIESSRKMQEQQEGFKATPDQAAQVLTAWVATKAPSALYNPFLTLQGFDVARDTPVELLHTILLGICRLEFYHQSLYSARLQSTNIDGLSIPPIRAGYIMQYANSLIGRQFKILSQVNSFHVHDLVDQSTFNLIKAIGELAAHLWYPEIRNMDEYLADIDIAVSNVLDLTAEIDGSKIITKMKHHLLVHLREDIRRFGPLVGVATEIYESFNSVFRLCSVHSNHNAPSRDIAQQFSHLESTKHILFSGWIPVKPIDDSAQAPTHQEWRQAGSAVRDLIREDSKKVDKKLQKRKEFEWIKTAAGQPDAILQISTVFPQDSKWHRCRAVFSQAKDECRVGHWVFSQSTTVEILPTTVTNPETRSMTPNRLVVLDVYSVSSQRHERYGMPVLLRPFGEDILFHFNIQHDCYHAKCTTSGVKRVQQERIQTEIEEKTILHESLDQYVINTHAFHNTHLLRATLPRTLTSPIPYVGTTPQSRASFHDTVSERLRTSQAQKAEARKVAKANEAKAQRAPTAQQEGEENGGGLAEATRDKL